MYSFKKILSASLVAALTAVGAAAQPSPQWLSKAVFYQIYPSSFQDSDGDGIGDLKGIASRLDYVQSLGANAIWLNPIFVSGWQDGGYDVIDYYRVDPRFGTNTDVVNLAAEMHRRGMKLVLDLVAGHTSDKNEWFLQSKSGKDLRYSDYYIWTDEIPESEKELIEKRHAEPDPSASTIGRFVEADAPHAKYYEKNFYESQPALNYGYANPDPTHAWEQSVDAPGPQATREELRNIMTFWFSKGVDGFRVDMAQSLVKNDPDKKETSRLWQEMRRWKDEKFPDKVLISEWFNPQVSLPAGFNVDFYIAGGAPWIQTPVNLFHFDRDTAPYFSREGKGVVKPFVDDFNNNIDAANNVGYFAYPTGNHDLDRMAQGGRNTADLKVAMTFILTLPGIPFIYYGDEIGMLQQFGLPSKEGSNERSGERTPMQWDNSATAGFSTASPDKIYLPVDTQGGTISVEAEDKDPESLLNYVRSLVRLRSSSDALGNDGIWFYVGNTDQPYPMVYKRSSDNEDYIVAINPSGKRVKTTIANQGANSATVVLQTGKGTYTIGKKGAADAISLNPASAMIVKLEGCRACEENRAKNK